jgi:hypothetical protein
MSEPFIEPFEVRKCVPEFLTANGIGKKERTAFSSVLQDESSHHFLLVQRKVFSHLQIIRRDPGSVTANPEAPPYTSPTQTAPLSVDLQKIAIARYTISVGRSRNTRPQPDIPESSPLPPSFIYVFHRLPCRSLLKPPICRLSQPGMAG